MTVSSQDSDILVMFNQGLVAYNAGNFDAAENIYHDILEKQPDHPEANHNIGILLVAKHEFHKALEFFKLALNTSPNVSLFWASYIDVLVKLERIIEAKGLIKAAQKAGLACERIDAISERFKLAPKALHEPNIQMLDYTKLDNTSVIVKKNTSAEKNENENEIILSICIPTFNRSRYLNVLLNDMSENFENFPFQYEIIISSNASTDDTDEVVHNFSNKLPIVYIKQEKNIGAHASLQDAFSYARGTFSIYLADDDFIDVQPLIEALTKFIDQPSAAILYAPWKMVTLKDKASGPKFFEVPHDMIFKKGDHLGLLKFILTHHIFPEIYIVRTNAFKEISPVINDLAFWAFTMASDYLSFGDVIFLETPFYLFVTHYFDDEVRTQAGNEQVEYAWDSYRGGLEYFSSDISKSLDKTNFDILQKAINEFVIVRMLVGLRVRIAKKRNPIDNYFLARRLCGLGKKAALPLDYNEIRRAAAIWYLGNNAAFKNKEAIIIVGDVLDNTAINILKSQTIFPVLRISKYEKGHQNAVFLFHELDINFQGDIESELLLDNIFLTQEMLMNKFI